MKKLLIIISLLCCSVVILLFFSIQIFLNRKNQLTNFVIHQNLFQSALPTPTSLTLPKLTLDSIFSTNHSWVNKLPKDKTVTIITTGDVIPARSVNFKMNSYNNFRYPFEKTSEFLKSADLTLINLEAPLIENCSVTNVGMIFCGNQKFIEGLLFAGIDIANLANNHILNYGTDGFYQTSSLLTKNGVSLSGHPNNNLSLRHVNNVTIGFLGWNLLEQFDEQQILLEIKQSKAKVNLLVVSLHWGEEYTIYPNQWQQDLAHQAVDSGADLIVGNHPHWIQPIEIYKERLIIYAHGNFIFDQEWSEQTKTGIIAKHTFYQNKLVASQFYPIYIIDYSQPQLVEGNQKQKLLNHLKEISSQLTKY